MIYIRYIIILILVPQLDSLVDKIMDILIDFILGELINFILLYILFKGNYIHLLILTL